ncbi:lysostaphin resistance A-like protein [Psychrobacillus sp. FJAT-51614]|uniref:Lysostaphin resistance A-like protein n=1 Tax=Psychrobacillus mangrovi TaxID=3117745 RepID=A0ABU8F4N4_9BACI
MLKHILLLIAPTIMIFLGLVVLNNVLITFLLFYGWLLFIPLVIRFWDKESRYRIMLPLSKKSIVVGIISGLVCLFSIYGFVSYFPVIDITHLKILLEEWDFSGTKVILFVLVLILINPFLEEFYWREFIYTRLLNGLGTVMSILITSLFYSLYHLIIVIEIFTFPFNVLAILPVFLAGIMWGIFRYKLNALTASIISHCLADIGIMLVYWTIVA